MKKIFTLVFLSCLLSAYCQAQNWALPSSRWIYEAGFCGGPNPCSDYAHYQLKVEKDTMVSGVNCRKITGDQRPMYTYDSGDTVYLYINGGYHAIYYFSAVAGDTIQLYNDTALDQHANTPTSALGRVDSVVIETWQNLSLKRFYVTTIGGPPLPFYDGKRFSYRERSGLVAGDDALLYPDLIVTVYDSYQVLCKYGDSSINNYWVPQAGFCDLTGIDPISSSTDMLISPNPASDYLKINTNLHSYNVVVSDVTGRTYSCGMRDTALDVRNLIAGFYFLTISADGHSSTKRFVKL